VEVHTHSGYRADDRPLEFVRDGCRHHVSRILEQRRVQSVSGTVSEEFRVLTTEGNEFRLVHHLDSDTWRAGPVK